MTGFSAPSMAQDIKSQLDAITKVIVANKANPDAAKKQVQEFYKANKKNAEALKNKLAAAGFTATIV